MADEFNIADPRFADPVAAAEYLESVRWPGGPVCPHCGEAERTNRLGGAAAKRRVYKCYGCRKQFTVMVGTIFESSHVPLNKWLAAFYLLCSSKKGMSAHQLHRMIGVTYKTAWFMFHRIREAMKEPEFTSMMGGEGGTIEADETYIGGRRRGQTGRPARDAPKVPVVALVERGGRARSFHVADVTSNTLGGVIRENVDASTRLMTDEWRSYKTVGKEMADHQTVAHSYGEYVRGDAYTNTVEGFFSILKRGVNGTYHHVSRAHLGRYLAEFDFRYNAREISDSQRTIRALSQVGGKRLRYRETGPA